MINRNQTSGNSDSFVLFINSEKNRDLGTNIIFCLTTNDFKSMMKHCLYFFILLSEQKRSKNKLYFTINKFGGCMFYGATCRRCLRICAVPGRVHCLFFVLHPLNFFRLFFLSDQLLVRTIVSCYFEICLVSTIQFRIMISLRFIKGLLGNHHSCS